VNIDRQLANFALRDLWLAASVCTRAHFEYVMHFRGGDFELITELTKPTTGVTRKPEITT